MTDIDQIHINFGSDSLWALNLALGLVMYGIALDIEIGQFKVLLRTPKLVLVGLLSQFVLLPALTFVLVLTSSEYRFGIVFSSVLSWRECIQFHKSFVKGKYSTFYNSYGICNTVVGNYDTH